MLLAELLRDGDKVPPVKFGPVATKAKAKKIVDKIKELEQLPNLSPGQQSMLKILKIELGRLGYGVEDKELNEGFFDSHYVVKRKDKETYEVAKFKGGKAPETVDVVKRLGKDKFDAPGYRRGQPNARAIAIVKQFIKDGEKPGTAYYMDGEKLVSKSALD